LAAQNRVCREFRTNCFWSAKRIFIVSLIETITNVMSLVKNAERIRELTPILHSIY
jgi:hypothetical protein